MPRLVLASNNAGKVAELRRILDGLGVDVVSASEAGLGDVDETGETFAENAFLKARAASTEAGLPAVADDSGLAVDALDGAPGVHSARYAGTHGDDAANLALVLSKLEGVADRRARFVCVAALVTPEGDEVAERGELVGTITEAPEGDEGFGYDPIFRPDGLDRTAAQLSPEEKDAISHRGRAFRALRGRLAELLGGRGDPG